MSTKYKNLTGLQKQIIDALANDYEDLAHIRELIDASATKEEIKQALWTLIEDGYVTCYLPTKTKMDLVTHPEHRKLGTYWFTLTDRGEQVLSVLETSS